MDAVRPAWRLEFPRHLLFVVLLSVLVGAVTGLTVAGVHALIVDGIWKRFDRDMWWVVLLPIAGLLGSTLVLSLTRQRPTETTEEYVRVFHEPGGRMRR